MYSREELAEGFRALGVAAGDVVMLHASVRAVGEIAGGPDQIHLALKDALTPSGTLLMYAGSAQYYDESGRGTLPAEEEAEVLRKLPPFDAATTRSSRDHGILVEFLRTYPGTRASDHVARFIAWGAQADRLLASQPWNYAYGRGSPLERLAELDGKILLLESDHDAVTFLHHVEHVATLPGKRVARFKVPVVEHGRRVWRVMEEVDTSDAGAHPNWPDRFFAKIVDSYVAAAGVRPEYVGDAESYLLPARALLRFARPLMERTAADPEAANGLREVPMRPCAADAARERLLWEAERNFWLGGHDVYEQGLADDAVMVVPPAGVLTRAETIASVAASARWREVSFGARQTVRLGVAGHALIYRARASRGDGGPEYVARCSSVYVERGGTWKLALHHQTPEFGQEDGDPRS